MGVGLGHGRIELTDRTLIQTRQSFIHARPIVPMNISSVLIVLNASNIAHRKARRAECISTVPLRKIEDLL